MLEVQHVGLRHAGRSILNDVSFSMEPGRIMVVIGPNGAGKSTLLRVISGALRPTQGQVLLHGRNVRGLNAADLAAHRAVLGQALALPAPFTVDAVARFGLPPLIKTATADRLVDEALAEMTLTADRSRAITTLSGGEQQRVHIARVLVQLRARADDRQPQLLLLDEPTAHLDPAYQHLLATVARRVATDGRGVFAVLHDLNLAAAIADEVVLLKDGQLFAIGPPVTTLTESHLRQLYGIDFVVNTQARGTSISARY